MDAKMLLEALHYARELINKLNKPPNGFYWTPEEVVDLKSQFEIYGNRWSLYDIPGRTPGAIYMQWKKIQGGEEKKSW
jgi:hypothetical protein